MYSISTKYSFQPPLTAGSGQFGFTLAWANAPESPWYCSWSTSCAGRGFGEARFWIRAAIFEGVFHIQNHTCQLHVFSTGDVKDSCWFWFTLPKLQVVRVVVSQNHPTGDISKLRMAAASVWTIPVEGHTASNAHLCIYVSCVHWFPHVFLTQTHTHTRHTFSDRYPASSCLRTPCWNWTRNSMVISWFAQRLRRNKT